MGRKNPLSCGAQCCRITLVTLNIVFLLCGIAFLVLGGIFRFGSDELKKEAETSLNEVSVGDYNLYDLSTNLAIIFMVVGAVMVVFSALGFIGACCMNRCSLVLYAILLAACLAVELAGVVMFFIMRKDFEDGVRKGLKQSIEYANNADDQDVKDAHQNSLEYLFREFKCCRVDDAYLNDYGDASGTCSVTSEYFTKDCYEALKDWVESYQLAFIIIGIAVMVIELMLITCACMVCRAAKSRYD